MNQKLSISSPDAISPDSAQSCDGIMTVLEKRSFTYSRVREVEKRDSGELNPLRLIIILSSASLQLLPFFTSSQKRHTFLVGMWQKARSPSSCDTQLGPAELAVCDSALDLTRRVSWTVFLRIRSERTPFAASPGIAVPLARERPAEKR